jgi:hypothetical protein
VKYLRFRVRCLCDNAGLVLRIAVLVVDTIERALGGCWESHSFLGRDHSGEEGGGVGEEIHCEVGDEDEGADKGCKGKVWEVC